MGDSAADALAGIRGRLEQRRTEIEQAVLTRTRSIADKLEATDPEYANGLRLAIAAAVDYGLDAIERGEEGARPAPAILLAQARLAARRGIALDTVLRRYFAGYALLGDFVIESAEQGGLRGGSLQRLLRTQAALFDRLLGAVGQEYEREAGRRRGDASERLYERVRRLLAGELVDTSGFSYDFEGNHLGAIAEGPGAAEALGALAGQLDRRLLLVPREEDVVWSWLGGREPFEAEDLNRALSACWPAGVALSLGEPGERLQGWRISHRQAQAAAPISLRERGETIRYRGVALLASAIQDDLLAASLKATYLVPLESERDGGEGVKQSLRAYFKAGQSTASAGALLGVTRQTVANRLRVAERRLGSSILDCAAELIVALRLEEFERAADTRGVSV